MYKFACTILIFCFINVAFSQKGKAADSIFLKNLSNKSVEEKKRILRLRLQFDSERDTGLETQLTMSTYLNLITTATEFQEVRSFIENSPNANFKNEATIHFQSFVTNHCKEIKAVCLGSPELFFDESSKSRLINFIKIENFDQLIDHEKTIAQFVTPEGVLEKFIISAYKSAVRMGMVNIANKLSKNLDFKTSTDIWLTFASCRNYYLNSEIKKSEKCFMGNNSPWFQLYVIYAQYLMSPSKTAQNNNIKAELEKHIQKLTYASYATVLYAQIFSQWPGNVTNKTLNEIANDYFLGFTLLADNKKKNYIPSNLQTTLSNTYRKKYGPSTLQKVLSGKLTGPAVLRPIARSHIIWTPYR